MKGLRSTTHCRSCGGGEKAREEGREGSVGGGMNNCAGNTSRMLESV